MRFSPLPAVKHGVEAPPATSAASLLLTTLGVAVACMLACIVSGAVVGLVR